MSDKSDEQKAAEKQANQRKLPDIGSVPADPHVPDLNAAYEQRHELHQQPLSPQEVAKVEQAAPQAQKERASQESLFGDFLKDHLSAQQGSLIVNNYILARNIFKLGLSKKVLDSRESSAIREIKTLWSTVNKGCNCTRNKRVKLAEISLVNYLNSTEGIESLKKVSKALGVKNLSVRLPNCNLDSPL